MFLSLSLYSPCVLLQSRRIDRYRRCHPRAYHPLVYPVLLYTLTVLPLLLRVSCVHTIIIQGLKTGQVGNLGIDVLEEEGNFFYEDMSGKILGDDKLSRLMTFPNVIITGANLLISLLFCFMHRIHAFNFLFLHFFFLFTAHQAFFTKEAVDKIALTTLNNITEYKEGKLKKENIVEKKK